MFTMIDCVRIKVPSLKEGMHFYVNQLGHEILWKTPTAIGLKLPQSNSEIVLHTEPEEGIEVDFKVNDVEQACRDYVTAGGSLIKPPFDIPIGKCSVVADPFGNSYILLDSSKGVYKTDEKRDVIGLKPKE